MPTPLIRLHFNTGVARHLRTGTLFLLLALSPTAYAAVYKCAAKDGSATYSDQPCDQNAEVIQVKPDSLHSVPATPATPQSLDPQTIGAARITSERERMANLCSTNDFNSWIKSQGHPLPDPNVRIAKMVEISNRCRRALHLEDMKPIAAIPTPKPILQGPAGTTAATNLQDLVKSGSIDRLQKYLSSPGTDINDRPGTDEALLDYAAEQNQLPVARLLLEHHALVDAVQTQGQNRGYTALHRAAVADAADVAQLLLAHGAEVNMHGPLGITPLILAASNGSARTAQVLLDHGADVLTADGRSETALSAAAAHNHPDIVRALLIHVPTPTSINLNAIAMRGDVDAMRLIVGHDELVHDIPVKLKDEALRFTILGPERFEERKQMLELLLADGTDIDNMTPGSDVIPLMLAQTPAMAEFLLVHGANKKARLGGPRLAQWLVCNNSGKDPQGTLQVLVAHGINIGGATPRGESAMPCAEHAHNAGLVAFLQVQQVAAGRPSNTVPAPTSRPATEALEAQLHPKRACVRLDQISGSPTPMELYGALNDCMENHRDAEAVALFALAGIDSAFDSLRVTDKTAGQARQILIMDLFQRMPPETHARFESRLKAEAADAPRHATLCDQVGKIGPPTYFPAYMVNHGMGVMQSALANQAPPTPLDPNFNAQAGWAQLLINYLNCTGPTPGVTQAHATAAAAATEELTPDGWPLAPDKHLASTKTLPAHDETILEVRNHNSMATPPNEIGVFNLTKHTEAKWDVLGAALSEWPATQFGAQADWAPQVGKFLYASTSSVHLVSRDGTAVELNLQMPGGLKSLDGMTAYSLSPDGQQLAYLLYTRDRTEVQEDKRGKLYNDLMIQKTAGSPPVSIWRDGFVLRPAWRPDGTAIAHTDSGSNLVLSDLTGKTLWSFHPGPPAKDGSTADFIQEIRWDPSGKRLAFLMGSPTPKIYLVNADGTGTKPIEFHNLPGTDRELSIRNFAWSPDGRRFALRAEADSKCNNAAAGFEFETGHFPCIYSRNLIVVDVDGSHLAKVTPIPDFDSGELFWIQ
jgi:Ankyrin repeats (3 copies)/Domain of unknown function (DUF4124)/Ankyrin repeats (many copies)